VNIDPGLDYYHDSVHVVEYASLLLFHQDLEEPCIQLDLVCHLVASFPVEYASTMLGSCLSPSCNLDCIQPDPVSDHVHQALLDSSMSISGHHSHQACHMYLGLGCPTVDLVESGVVMPTMISVCHYLTLVEYT
jgi:hypothetical protein